MISNERPSPYGSHAPYRPYNPNMPQKPRMEEHTLKREALQVERKIFIFTVKENQRGRFLRITEEVQGRFNNMIIPAAGLAEFQKVLGERIKASAEIKAKAP